MKNSSVVVWFRNDLRVHDHEALFQACKNFKEVIPVYSLDPRMFVKTQMGFSKTGSFRAVFLKEAVDNLRFNLRKLDSDLFILTGKPEDTVVEFAANLEASSIYYSTEITQEEKLVEDALERNAWGKGIATKGFWQSTLFHIEDIPFPINQLPEVFTKFRKECEKFSWIRKTFPIPEKIKLPPLEISPGVFPDLAQFQLMPANPSIEPALKFIGGESSGIARLQAYFWERDCLKVYKETRNGLLGPDYSSKFSAWLAMGCLSPRFIYEEVKRYEIERIENQSTYWLRFELIWRDYFRFICKKHGNKVFGLNGINSHVNNWLQNRELFDKWAEGQTGIPFVDANMRELNESGFMSNRGRQNVASFLVNDMGIDWRWGASYFESKLIDYDVCSNWGNWMYIAGVGNDRRQNRRYNPVRQAMHYDPKGEYVRHWIPELKKITGFDIHQPYEMKSEELKKSGVFLGRNYPFPCIETKNVF